ncbi:MAG TPA: DUF421 domain-containing protein, partial [Actinomycetota bacterium]|nr:DUF421 domain-containing protein [Actinomycetota bacterium]
MGLLPDEASSLLVVAVSTAVFYVISVAGLRLAGRRTLAEMSAFDWVVTVAIGSMIANASLNPSVSVAEGTAGLATLLTLQGLVAAVRRRSGKARRLTDFEPVILVHDGQVSERGLDRLQMTRADLMSKL